MYYRRWPQQLLVIGGCITLVCFIVCEWLVHKKRFASLDPDRVEKLYNNAETKSTNEDIEAEEVIDIQFK